MIEPKSLDALVSRLSTPGSTCRDLKAKLRRVLRAERTRCAQETPSRTLWGPAQQRRAFDFLGLTGSETDVWFASYFPIRSELDLTTFASPAWLFPYSDVEHSSLRWFHLRDLPSRSSVNSFGVPEAAFAETFAYDGSRHAPLVVFVPCLAASVDGMRLGYGGGYYDRFLAQGHARVVTIACIPDGFLFDRLPSESHDFPVDIVATTHGCLARESASQLLCKVRT